MRMSKPKDPLIVTEDQLDQFLKIAFNASLRPMPANAETESQDLDRDVTEE